MVAQKYKKEMMEEIFIFKCLPTRNPTNVYKTLLILSDHMGVLENYFCLKIISKLASR